MSQMSQVVEFNQSVLGVEPRKLGMQSDDEFNLSMTQLQEEMNEIMTARADSDFIGVIDGLVDLEYFLLGILYKCGISPELHEKIFSAVHKANTMKVMGVKQGREGFDAADAIKPEGWVAPEEAIDEILCAHEFRESTDV